MKYLHTMVRVKNIDESIDLRAIGSKNPSSKSDMMNSSFLFLLVFKRLICRFKIVDKE